MFAGIGLLQLQLAATISSGSIVEFALFIYSIAHNSVSPSLNVGRPPRTGSQPDVLRLVSDTVHKSSVTATNPRKASGCNLAVLYM